MACKQMLINTFLCFLLALTVQAKPSHPHFDYAAIPDHFDFAPPVLPPPHFHAAPAPLPLPLAAPVPVPAPAHFPLTYHHQFAAPVAPLVPAPAPLPLTYHHQFAAPVAPLVPAPAALPVLKALPPVFEPVPFTLPSYRAIPGPKTTTHHVSFGYAFPTAPLIAKAHHHHHSIF